MPTGYAIVYARAGRGKEPELRVMGVVWDAAEAAETVQRLNAHGRGDR